jgi:hypothetical protein
MNLVLHFRRQSVIYHAMTRDERFPYKQRRDYPHAVMPTAGRSASMAGMLGALVFNYNLGRG